MITGLTYVLYPATIGVSSDLTISALPLSTKITIKQLISIVEESNLTISASGALFKTDEQSICSRILQGWFEKREHYRGLKKKAGKEEDWANYKLYDFRVTVSSDTADLDRNQLTGKIYIKPTRSLEFIDITFYITPTGASFDNI